MYNAFAVIIASWIYWSNPNALDVSIIKLQAFLYNPYVVQGCAVLIRVNGKRTGREGLVLDGAVT